MNAVMGAAIDPYRKSRLSQWLLVGAFVLSLSAVGCAVKSPEGQAARDDAPQPDGFERIALRAQQFRGQKPVLPLPDGSIVAEAEEFHAASPGGWRAKDWGENYYAATFAITFLSRKAFLGAPAQCDRSEAAITVRVPRAGRYLALVRYEAVYLFETQFTLRIEQNGQVRLQRLYGARKNLKVWAFDERLKEEVARPWVENVVWEGHDATVDLEAGMVKITLIADKQPEPAARRNVDLVMLTTDHEQVKTRIEKEGYLPLDGMLTQAGDVYLKVHNAGASAATVNVGNGTEHSPYWVHIRQWKPVKIETAAGQTSDWTEVGSLLDSLNDGQWHISAASAKTETPLNYRLEFGVRNAAGVIESIKTFDAQESDLWLAYDANTRYSRRIRTNDLVLYDLLDYLKAHPVPGAPPRRTIVYAYTFDPRKGDDRYNAAVGEFVTLMGITVTAAAGNPALTVPSGYIDLPRELGVGLEPALDKLKADGVKDKIRTVSVGDEIDLQTPPADDHDGFRAWAKAQSLTPSDVVPGTGDDWSTVLYNSDPGLAKSDPRAYYYARLYAHAYGINALKSQTDKIKKALPHADVGANYTPQPTYLGEAHKYITVFRRGGLTMPWGEDYAWQIPIGTQQISFLQMDLFRAGNRYNPEQVIHFYVMAHWPGNTVKSWRRMWYGALGHGMKIANLFEFRPVQAAPNENHVSLPRMYLEVRRSIYELSSFEDIVQDGRIRWGTTALWYSATGDAWHDDYRPFGPEKRLLYAAITHQQLALDIVDEEDALKGTLQGYTVLYLTDPHVSDAASNAIADWVRRGGHVFATANAGMFNQFNQPNETLRGLLAVDPHGIDTPADSRVVLDKWDLPFAKVFDTVTWQSPAGPMTIPVVGARSPFTTTGSQVTGTFADGSPAVSVRKVGKGTATYVGFLPGLSYFKPAIPLRPVDRGTTDDAMAHFIPTRFDPVAHALIGSPAQGVPRAVECSNHLVQATVIESAHGIAVPLVNWSGAPIKGLRVTLAAKDLRTGKVSLAGGGKVERVNDPRVPEGKAVLRLDLDVADALILR